MKMYRTHRHNTKIEAVETTKVTATRVYFVDYAGRETFENKQGDWTQWHHTWVEAQVFLVARERNKAHVAHAEMEKAEAAIADLELAEEPQA